MVTHNDPYILVNKAVIFWDYNNILDKVSNETTYNSVKKMLKKGYWTFSMLRKEIESYGTVSSQVIIQ